MRTENASEKGGNPQSVEYMTKTHATLWSMAIGLVALLLLFIAFGGTKSTSNPAVGFNRSPAIAVTDPF
jgi:hypothetical protein